MSMEHLKTVLETYPRTQDGQGGKANYDGKPYQVILKKELPAFFKKILSEERREQFEVKGSFGEGNTARVPWVAVFNKEVTETAQDGYYIVLLFSEDMSSCYLSLNQGITAFKKQYSAKIARQKIKETAERALKCFVPNPKAVLGKINLAATLILGKDYELGAIESFHYKPETLPTEQQFTDDFKVLLAHYDRLIDVVGVSLQSLAPVSEEQFQQTVLEKAQAIDNPKNLEAEEAPGGHPIPPKQSGKSSGGYVRNPSTAAKAIAKANFKCELDPNHLTFISRAKDLPYVEAHHIIPMSQQAQYKYSLDVTANIVALCPLCHKLLHHAKPEEKKSHLLQLLKLRKDKLEEKKIAVKNEKLLSYYNNDLLDDET